MTDHRSYTHNLSSCEIKAWKKLQAWTGFEPMTSANIGVKWAIKPAESWPRCGWSVLNCISSVAIIQIWLSDLISRQKDLFVSSTFLDRKVAKKYKNFEISKTQENVWLWWIALSCHASQLVFWINECSTFGWIFSFFSKTKNGISENFLVVSGN